MTTSKSPRRVLQVAYDVACRALPAHRHRFSPKKFTQHQLLACLVLKEFSRLDYRGLADHLADHPDLTRLIELEVVPHFTTFQKAAARLLAAKPGRAMFDAVLARALRDKVRKRRVPLAAVDGTGLESRHVSRYYVKRRSKTGAEAGPGRLGGLLPRGSHRSGLAQLRHPARHVMLSLRGGTPSGPRSQPEAGDASGSD